MRPFAIEAVLSERYEAPTLAAIERERQKQLDMMRDFRLKLAQRTWRTPFKRLDLVH